MAGLLLYARTKEPVVPDDSCEIDGTLIAAKTLDLSLPFPEIAAQLDRIAQPLLDKSMVRGILLYDTFLTA